MSIMRLNMTAFRGGFEAWLDRKNAKAIEAFRNYGRNIFDYIVFHTPEYTGGTAASWKFGVGAESGDQPNYFPVLKPPYAKASAGNENSAAIAIARAEGERGAQAINSLADGIFISNPAQFIRGDLPNGASSTYIAAAMQDGNGWLRRINQPGDAVKQALSYYSGKNWYSGGIAHEF